MIHLTNNEDFTGFTFVIASVSVGNVGQLSLDLLIQSLSLRKVGILYHKSIIPLAGNNPYSKAKCLSLSCELYSNTELKLVVLQIRSGLKGNVDEFIKELITWVKKQQINQVVILTGFHAHERIDSQLFGEPLRYVFCEKTKIKYKDIVENGEWEPLEKAEESSKLLIPGGGIASRLFQASLEFDIPAAILVEFCSDGNNLPDAFTLTNYVDKLLKLKERAGISKWTVPPSWNLLNGPPPPLNLL